MSSNATLVARFAAPMQSWSTDQGKRRSSERVPTKSGIVGICARSLGLDLSDIPSWRPLAELRYGVRSDRPGTTMVEYQSAGGGELIPGSNLPYYTFRADKDRKVFQRWQEHLNDACFLVCLSGERDLVSKVGVALDRPERLWGLGKLACPPIRPVVLDVLDEDLVAVLRTYGLVDIYGEVPTLALAEWDAVPDGESTLERRFDVPVDFVERRYAARFVRSEQIEVHKLAAIVRPAVAAGKNGESDAG